ncbi:hypothetical protein WR25_22165 [Diploscapter pachys]|uniref:DH domain-containing protein n=1 Tax=Diploscapter pachys TaxID=2018661 RepID=A0A2A2JA78_9BILA|nr:hypothetical protein WR25_22165 [Diploscapter pachys]
MAWRYQASKFKNTAPKLPKKEDVIFDLPIGTLSCTDNGIQASADFLAFHIEGDGGKLGVVPVGTKGRKLRKDIGIVHAHGEMINDFSFMPFADELLVTCSRDDKVKVWRLSSSAEPLLAGELDLGTGRLIEALKPHSTASNIVAFVSTETAFITDVNRQTVFLELSGINDKGQSLDWSEDGKLLAISSDKGKEISIYDPRSGSTPIVTFASHQGLGREGRVLFAGDRLLSSGFTSKRIQEVRLWDAGKWSEPPIHTQEFVSTTGVLIPHYDPDTKLVFLSGKGTNKLFLLEQQDRQPHLSWVTELTLPEQTLGACIGSKRRVTVMDGEVDTYYQLTRSSIIPVPCIVPRRSYRDFHADLFPETRGSEAACTGAEWFNGANGLPPKISLAPAGKASPPPQEPTPTPSSLTTVGLAAIRTPQTMGRAGVDPVKILPDNDMPAQSSAPIQQQTTKRIQEVEEPTHDRSVNLPTKDRIKELDYGMEIKKNDSVPELTKKEPVHIYERFTKADDKENKKEENSDPIVTDPSTSSSLLRTPSAVSAVAPCSAISPDPTQAVASPTLSSTSSNRIRMRANRQRPKSCVVGQITSKYRHVETLADTLEKFPSLRAPDKKNRKPYFTFENFYLENFRKYVLRELVETEKDYVRDLTSVVDGYIANLEKMDLPPDLVGKDKIIFANISQILEFHKNTFLNEISKCEENYEAAGSAFVKCHRRLEGLYVKYCQNKPKSDYLVSQEDFEGFFAETKAKLGHKVALSDLLIKPVQRIMKYQLLLKDILKYTERANDRVDMLKKALDVMHVVPKACDDMMQVGRLQNFDGNLSAQGKLIHQGTLSISEVQAGAVQKAKDRRIFLFEQSAILADHIPPKKEFGNPIYIFKSQIMVNKMVFEPNQADDPLKFTIKSSDPSQPTSFLAIAQNKDEKDEWVRHINEQLDQQKRLLAALVDPKRYMGGTDDVTGGMGNMNIGGNRSPGPTGAGPNRFGPPSPATAPGSAKGSAPQSSSKPESPKKESKSKLFSFGKKSNTKSPTSPPPVGKLK